jgi:hypothetical protein
MPKERAVITAVNCISKSDEWRVSVVVIDDRGEMNDDDELTCKKMKTSAPRSLYTIVFWVATVWKTTKDYNAIRDAQARSSKLFACSPTRSLH